MIDKELSRRATAEDRVLLKANNSPKIKLLDFVGERWRLKRVPMVGTIISDPDFIHAVMGSGSRAYMGFWGQETSKSGFAVMNPTLRAILSDTLSHERLCHVRGTVIETFLAEASDSLRRGEEVDIVELAHRTCYLSMWRALGLPEERLTNHDLDMILRTFLSATEVLNKRDPLSGNDKDLLESRLTFLTTVSQEAYSNPFRASLPSQLRENGWSEEAAVRLTQRLFLSGADSAARFLTRMAALFVKTRYIDHLSDDLSHLPNGMDEAYRIICPIPSIPLRATEQLEFNGTTVMAGEKTLLSMVGVSRKFGDFNPFNHDVPTSIRFGQPFPVSVGEGDCFARTLAEEFGRFLAEANSEGKVVVAEQASDDHTHVGSYKRLVIVQQEG